MWSMRSAVTAALDSRIKPIGGVKPFCGVAVTCNDGPADNLATYASLNVAQPGDVVLSAAGGFTEIAIIGDLLLGMMKNLGVVAYVTDGAVRDIAGIRAVGLPCYAAGSPPIRRRGTGPGRSACRWSAAASRSARATSSSATRTAWWWCRSPGSTRRSRGSPAVKSAEADLEAKVKARPQDAAPPPDADRRAASGSSTSTEHMRIAMIGAGAMGAMFGARFAQAGAEVVLYDDDATHVAAINAERASPSTRRDGELRVPLVRDDRRGGDRPGRHGARPGRQQCHRAAAAMLAGVAAGAASR